MTVQNHNWNCENSDWLRKSVRKIVLLKQIKMSSAWVYVTDLYIEEQQ